MGETAAATVKAAIDGYRSGSADQVLEQFHQQALIIGTREDERWESREDAREALTHELGVARVEGPLTESGAEEAFLHPVGDDVTIFYRDGYMVFNGKRVRGRWTAALKADEAGDWMIVHSHFSLAEGHTTPDSPEEYA